MTLSLRPSRTFLNQLGTTLFGWLNLPSHDSNRVQGCQNMGALGSLKQGGGQIVTQHYYLPPSLQILRPWG